MIYSLTGKVFKIDDNTIAVDTGSMAFEVICSCFTVFELAGKSEVQTVLTYLQVREDAMCLYGFANKKEKLLFNDLISVSGVGPKMAITILSGLPVDDLVRAISASDVKTLTSIKGFGKKTAENVVLQLHSRFGGSDALESLVSGDTTAVSGKQVLSKEIEEAAEVLANAGIQKMKAIEIAKFNFVSGMTAEELVVACFKNLR